MKTIGNILWVVFCGWIWALGWLLWALLFACTIIGLPFARQCLKLAHFTLWPFGRTAVKTQDGVLRGIGAVLWFVPGLFFALGYAISGVLLCITVIGIPFGMQAFKFAELSLAPFGRKIVRESELHTATAML